MKRLCLTCLVVCALCASFPVHAAEKTVIHLLSTPFGTGSYVLGTALESIVNQGGYPLSIAHAETPGQAYNVNKLNADAAARQNTVVTASQGINWLASQGKKPFPARRTPLKLIGIYTYTATWLVTGDKNIRNMADLKGKRIAMGRIPQVIWGYEPDALLRNGYGDDFYNSLKIQFVGTSEAATALINGQVDAATIGGYMDPISGRFSPAPQTVEVLAAGRDLTHLDWT
ncbi:TAXI family TRAP transporter solute-binding subunit, partial [uncultured Desulfovibrio sp.]